LSRQFSVVLDRPIFETERSFVEYAVALRRRREGTGQQGKERKESGGLGDVRWRRSERKVASLLGPF